MNSQSNNQQQRSTTPVGQRSRAGTPPNIKENHRKAVEALRALQEPITYELNAVKNLINKFQRASLNGAV